MGIFLKKLKDFFTVPDTFDPDDLRLRRVCNGVLVILGLIGLTSAAFSVYGAESLHELIVVYPDYFYIFLLSLLTFFLSVGLFFLNRWQRTPRNLVGWILVISLIALTSVIDDPQSLTNGRSVFAWAIPIILSTIVLPPAAVFVVIFLITFLFMYFSGFRNQYFQIYTLCELYMVAFLSWLGMSIADRAIRDARNESQKNRAVLDGVADGVVVIGRDNKIVLANPPALELMNGEMPKILSATERIEIGGRILSLRWSKVQGVGRIAIVHDITRQIEIERAKDALLSVVSHEMRTPLSAILGFAELLKNRPDLEMVERIRVNVLRMIGTIDNMLDLAQLQSGALKMYPEKFSPRLLASEANKALCAHAAEKQVLFKIAVSEALPNELTGDFHKYQQILVNLVDNAIKFTPAGGCVDISLAPHSDADKWQIVVRDTGIGIPPERLPDIFLPFRRGSDYTKRRYQGTGLGLSLAKSFAQLARGDIQVKSTVGSGSTFIVTLPINGGA